MKFGPRVWALIMDAVQKGVYDNGIGVVPRHVFEYGNTYMVKMADDALTVLVVEDVGRIDRDHLERQVDLLEDYVSSINVGASPKLLDPESRWYSRMMEHIDARHAEIKATRDRIAEMKKEISSKSGIRTYRIPVAQFKMSIISFDIVGTKEFADGVRV